MHQRPTESPSPFGHLSATRTAEIALLGLLWRLAGQKKAPVDAVTETAGASSDRLDLGLVAEPVQAYTHIGVRPKRKPRRSRDGASDEVIGTLPDYSCCGSSSTAPGGFCGHRRRATLPQDASPNPAT